MNFQTLDDDNDRGPKARNTDRILVLSLREGGARGTSGLLDNRLFKGSNRLHAIIDGQTLLWSLKYDEGIIPPVLRQRFTSFQFLLDYCRNYFDKRNIDIKEVID